jgi:predicted amidohydrolase
MLAAVDAGSAGSATFPGLRKYIADPAKTRVLAFLNIAMEGLAWAGMAGSGKGGELDNLNQVSVLGASTVPLWAH